MLDHLLPLLGVAIGAALTYGFAVRRERRAWELGTKHRVYSDLLTVVTNVLQAVQDAAERLDEKRRMETFLKVYAPALDKWSPVANAALLLCGQALADFIEKFRIGTHEATIAFPDSSKWPDPEKVAHGGSWPIGSALNAAAEGMLREMRNELKIGRRRARTLRSWKR